MGDAEEDPPGGDETRELARAAKRGEEGRFAELYERIAPALFTWACLRIRPAMRGNVDPEDLVQEVWCRAWKAFPAFDPETGSFRLWVFRIAKNVMLEAFRKVQRNSGGAGAAGPSTRLFQLQNVPDSATAISRRMARHEGLQAVLAWADALDEDEQKLFLHCGLEGMPYADVAERMQLQYDTVAKRWQKLRERVASFAAPGDLLAV
ncbi:MAG TPA: sigma-70 family RNA polymerase sigma factor [Planctomycetota bacterium]|jgi:RNA polymerase sigma-70 factor (ECF subfamily)|nr:sigma-70 family RNA polymerase sigma factor [Planctomycetota bacterium]